MKKEFMKIGGAKTLKQFYEMYPTEEAFLAKHGGAVMKLLAKGGEAYPQIATFDKAFSYGVPPGPQYLAHGGSAFPQAQTEEQFFIPIYTDVANPYNKAYGGSNVEMYPNAKTTPHWGPSNVWFQDGGQDMPQQEPELDRAGALNRTGAFVSILKNTAAKSNARTALNQVGMAKYGKQLSIYAPGGNTNYTVSGNVQPYVSQQMSPTSSQFVQTPYFGVDPPSYDHQLLNNMMARGIIYNPYQGQGFYPGQQINLSDPRFYPGINPYPMGNMSNFLPSIYDWNNMNQFMYQVKGSPKYKWKTNVPGQGKQRGVSNMDFLNAIFPELYGDTDAQMKALNDPKYAGRRQQWGISEITNTPKGLFGKRRQTTIKFGDFAGTGAGADAGPSQTPMDMTRKNQPGPLATQSDDPIPFTLDDANAQLQQKDSRAKAIMDNLQNALTLKPGQKSASGSPSTTQTSGSPSQPGTASSPSSVNPDVDYITNSKYPDLDQPFTGTNMTQRERLIQQLNSSDPKEVEYAKYRIGVMNDWDAMQGSTTTTSQPPSNPNSMDAATAQKKAGAMNPNKYVNQAFIDALNAQQAAAQQASSFSNPQNISPADIQNIMQVSPSYKTSDDAYNYMDAVPQPTPPYQPAVSTSPATNPNNPYNYTQFYPEQYQSSGPPMRTPVGPVVGPEGFAYGGYAGYRYGGSYKKGDVVYMSDNEIAEFIRNGGQIEEME